MNTQSTNAIEIFQKVAASGLVALLCVIAPAAATAQQQPAAKPQAAAAKPAVDPEDLGSVAPRKPGEEGLRVHGHWVMDLKDKDGKLVEHRDFQNAIFVSAGTANLTNVLMGLSTPGNFAIAATQGVNPVNEDAGAGSIAYVLYPTGAVNARGSDGFCNYVASGYTSHCSAGLTQSVFTATATTCAPGASLNVPDSNGNFANCGNASGIILQGAFTASGAVLVDNVETRLLICAESNNFSVVYTPVISTTSPATCRNSSVPSYLGSLSGASSGESRFTGTPITPLAVADGQTLSITVTLSFS